MTAKFTVNLSPLSLNAMYCRDMRYKSARYKTWQMSFIMQLWKLESQTQMKKLREAYCEGDSFAVRLTFNYAKFLNKAGLITAHTEDLTNVEKPIVDLIFGAKFHVLPEPYGVPNLNVDDRFIVSLLSRKRQSKVLYDTIDVTIKLLKKTASELVDSAKSK